MDLGGPIRWQHLTSQRAADPLGQFCNEDTNIGSNSKISANIDNLLAEVVTKAASTAYIATSYGNDPDKVYGLAQCRGDVSSKDCYSCIQDARQSKSVNVVLTRLMQGYDFNRQLGDLMDKIRSEAVMPENEGLGKGKTKLSPFVTLYALVQCTRDLSQIDCAQCLAIAVGNFPNFCNNRKGCRVLYSSCYVRYELYPFFFPIDSNNTSPVTSEVMVLYP
ncbi:hypothetical protein SLEP1_g3032 [Rubroshorea leprosula]|uniref:Gnk2-homologous domain-containing protein n=1 Tax=Rubroshorea leprosula TaxID=152421 RepID=A0AAV5HTF2_9ROSI|nr:hypothetical protein SLEP1_g3032 [Rubroshorea leprosula]